MTPEARKLVARLSAAQTLALTMWGEARARYEPLVGWVENPRAALVDIANVVLNRVQDKRWAALGVKRTCLSPHQFSCWSPIPGKPGNHEALLERAQGMLAGEMSDKLVNCVLVAHSAVNRDFQDDLDHATHYYATWIDPPPWAAAPAVMTAERWGHRFFKHVR